ncbi:beta strand repeat-containing protein, partial [Aquincola tertiaricarbonis]|uniref:beta strand repeat-containing protein n=1 Tax=Aquincola tertiaricarbonis TaxID=391953 RepID=UPI000615303F
ITAVNDAPVLTPATPALPGLTEDQTASAGHTVASLVGGSIADVDGGALQGIAITAASAPTGGWQYSLDGGGSWQALGAVSDGSALLLRGTDRLRFVPDGANAASATIGFRAWDRSSGSAGSKVSTAAAGGTSAFSTATDTASISVSAVNDAPVLMPIAPTLASVPEWDTNPPGQTVASFAGGSIGDVDAGALQGIAVTAQSPGTGSWQYSLDGGASWLDMAPLGPLGDANALLLRATDLVRLVPDGVSATTGSLGYRAWDRSSGSAGSLADASANGGSSAFSSATDVAGITVSNGNAAPVLAPAAPVLPGLTEDDTAHAGQTVASVLGGSVSDPNAGAAQGVAVTAQVAGAGGWQFSTDGGASWQAMGAVSDASALLLRATDRVRYLPDGSGATSASFSYRAWDQTSGSAGSLADASLHGGSSAFSSASDTASISVTALNDAPVLSPAAPAMAGQTEDQLAPAGQTVASLLGGSISDADAGALQGIAVTAQSAGGGSWQYSLDGGSSWAALGAVSDAQARLLRPADLLRHVPDGANGGTVSLAWRAWDQTSGSAGAWADASVNGGTSAFSAATDTTTLVVSAVNDAPVLTPAAPVLPAQTEDELNPAGHLVATLLGGPLSDVDSGALQGVALIGQSAAGGSWQFSIDAGGSWQALGAVSDAAALLLRSSDLVRFMPDGLGGSTASLSFRGWDRSSGSAGSLADASMNGGSSAFSSASDTATLAVGAVNDAPVLAPTAPVLAPLTEDETANAGQAVASILGGAISDVDPGALAGIAVTGLASGNGGWQFSQDGGASWSAIGAVSDASARLLRPTDRVRFVPDGANATSASLSYRAWDQTSGSAGALADASLNGGSTAFSSATDTASLGVSAVNDAPLLTPAAPVLPTLTEDDTAGSGQTVAALLGGSVSGVDSGALQGIAITGQDPGRGSWQISTDGGASWTAVGSVSDGSALLLRDIDSIRFLPDGSGADNASLSYRAWDQTSGSAGSLADASLNGGSTAFSSASDTATLDITAVNDAPVLTPAAPVLPSVTEDQASHGGQTVAAIVGSSIADADAGALQGIALSGLVAGSGNWQFSLNGGASWSAVGSVSDGSALLLRSGDLLRLVPDGQNGTAASITYRAWDQTSGSAGSKVDSSTASGSSAFSSASDTASLTVTSVNDAPVLTPAAPSLPALTEDDANPAGQTVAALLGGSVADVDGGALQGIAVIGRTAQAGAWQYSLDGGASWQAVGAVSDAGALLLRASDRLRFLPDGSAGSSNSLSYLAWDQTSGVAGGLADVRTAGGSSAFSLAADTLGVSVSDVNDAPVLTPAAPVLPSLSEDTQDDGGTSVASLVGSSISDADGGALQGIAVHGAAATGGTWQYSTDGGGSWQALPSVSDAGALLLRGTDRVRMLPAGSQAGSASLSYRAWDQ